MSGVATRFLVLRVPNSRPKALAGVPNDLASAEEAEARIAEIYAAQLKRHHTYLEIAPYSGSKAAFLEAEGILS